MRIYVILFSAVAFLLYCPAAFSESKDYSAVDQSYDGLSFDAKDLPANVNDIPSLVEEFSGWQLLVGKEDGIKICYAIKKPFAKIGNNTDERFAYLMFIYYNRNKQNINISMGMNLKDGAQANLSVDGRKFIASSSGSIVIPNSQVAFQITKAMLYSKTLYIKGDSRINTYAVDSYDISDFKDIYYKLAQHCDYM